MADQLWLMTRIREEEEEAGVEGNLHPHCSPVSTSANTPAEGNQRFHQWTESLWIPVT